MSAVLPTLPTLINLKDIKAYIDGEIEKGIEKALSSKNYVSIEEHNSLKSVYIDTVELLANAMKRITQLENVIFEHNTEGDIIRDKDNQPVLNTVPLVTSEIPVVPNTTLERKAMELVTRITGKIKPGKNEVFMDNAELNHFLKSELPEELKSNDTNLRRVKKRVIDKAKQLFPDSIFINKSKYGRHETRIVFKQPYLSNRNGTLV
jgi:hypothetical protein